MLFSRPQSDADSPVTGKGCQEEKVESCIQANARQIVDKAVGSVTDKLVGTDDGSLQDGSTQDAHGTPVSPKPSPIGHGGCTAVGN